MTTTKSFPELQVIQVDNYDGTSYPVIEETVLFEDDDVVISASAVSDEHGWIRIDGHVHRVQQLDELIKTLQALRYQVAQVSAVAGF